MTRLRIASLCSGLLLLFLEGCADDVKLGDTPMGDSGSVTGTGSGGGPTTSSGSGAGGGVQPSQGCASLSLSGAPIQDHPGDFANENERQPFLVQTPAKEGGAGGVALVAGWAPLESDVAVSGSFHLAFSGWGTSWPADL